MKRGQNLDGQGRGLTSMLRVRELKSPIEYIVVQRYCLTPSQGSIDIKAD